MNKYGWNVIVGLVILGGLLGLLAYIILRIVGLL